MPKFVQARPPLDDGQDRRWLHIVTVPQTGAASLVQADAREITSTEGEEFADCCHGLYWGGRSTADMLYDKLNTWLRGRSTIGH
jgi:hypothetical protein